MTAQDRKDWYKILLILCSVWWIVLLSIFLGWVTIKTNEDASHSEHSEMSPGIKTPSNEPGWSLATTVIDHNANTCSFATQTLFNETVFVTYPDFVAEEKLLGRWMADTNTIELRQPNGLTLDIVAHEVSHMVDTFMARYPNVDPHYEAYIQGFWTDCVYQLMIRDIEIASSGNFNFAH